MFQRVLANLASDAFKVRAPLQTADLKGSLAACSAGLLHLTYKRNRIHQLSPHPASHVPRFRSASSAAAVAKLLQDEAWPEEAWVGSSDHQGRSPTSSSGLHRLPARAALTANAGIDQRTREKTELETTSRIAKFDDSLGEDSILPFVRQLDKAARRGPTRIDWVVIKRMRKRRKLVRAILTALKSESIYPLLGRLFLSEDYEFAEEVLDNIVSPSFGNLKVVSGALRAYTHFAGNSTSLAYVARLVDKLDVLDIQQDKLGRACLESAVEAYAYGHLYSRDGSSQRIQRVINTYVQVYVESPDLATNSALRPLYLALVSLITSDNATFRHAAIPIFESLARNRLIALPDSKVLSKLPKSAAPVEQLNEMLVIASAVLKSCAARNIPGAVPEVIRKSFRFLERAQQPTAALEAQLDSAVTCVLQSGTRWEKFTLATVLYKRNVNVGEVILQKVYTALVEEDLAPTALRLWYSQRACPPDIANVCRIARDCASNVGAHSLKSPLYLAPQQWKFLQGYLLGCLRSDMSTTETSLLNATTAKQLLSAICAMNEAQAIFSVLDTSSVVKIIGTDVVLLLKIIRKLVRPTAQGLENERSVSSAVNGDQSLDGTIHEPHGLALATSTLRNYRQAHGLPIEGEARSSRGVTNILSIQDWLRLAQCDLLVGAPSSAMSCISHANQGGYRTAADSLDESLAFVQLLLEICQWSPRVGTALIEMALKLGAIANTLEIDGLRSVVNLYENGGRDPETVGDSLPSSSIPQQVTSLNPDLTNELSDQSLSTAPHPSKANSVLNRLSAHRDKLMLSIDEQIQIAARELEKPTTRESRNDGTPELAAVSGDMRDVQVDEFSDLLQLARIRLLSTSNRRAIEKAQVHGRQGTSRTDLPQCVSDLWMAVAKTIDPLANPGHLWEEMQRWSAAVSRRPVSGHRSGFWSRAYQRMWDQVLIEGVIQPLNRLIRSPARDHPSQGNQSPSPEHCVLLAQVLELQRIVLEQPNQPHRIDHQPPEISAKQPDPSVIKTAEGKGRNVQQTALRTAFAAALGRLITALDGENSK